MIVMFLCPCQLSLTIIVSVFSNVRNVNEVKWYFCHRSVKRLANLGGQLTNTHVDTNFNVFVKVEYNSFGELLVKFGSQL